MNWLLDLSIRNKLLLAFGVMLLLLAGVIAGAYGSLSSLQASQRQMYERNVQISQELVEFRADENRLRTEILEMQLETRTDELHALERDIQAKRLQADRRLAHLYRLSEGDPRITAKLDAISRILVEYRRVREEQIRQLYAGQVTEARRLGLGEQRVRFDRMRDIALELDAVAQKQVQQRFADNERRLRLLLAVFIGLAALALMVGVSIALLLNRVIAGPLTELTGRAERLASGELDSDLPDKVEVDRDDEIGIFTEQFNRMSLYLKDKALLATRIAEGDLTVAVTPGSKADVLGHALHDMTEGLRDMADIARRIAAGDLAMSVRRRSERDVLGQAFADMVDDLRRINREIREGVAVLTVSATDILSSTARVSHSAARTSAAVVETTTTAAQVRQTSETSALQAKGLSQGARQVTDVSESGRAAVEQSIEGMRRIHNRMGEVVDAVVQLSGQSLTIAEIISTVGDLAEQSNLLALNASIEAAKAGEQGKGFAVVAQEVKALAAQSRDATAQVRRILSEVQKATQGTVSVVQEGSAAVEQGLAQSQQAGETIRLLSDRVNEGAQAAVQIGASAQQQMAGMDQLVLAMENIRDASTENLQSAKQGEQAAQRLHELGQRLKRLVERYRVSLDEAG